MPEINASPYGWPIRPFDRPHAIRSGFDDPRIGRRGNSFHFGIDIAAADSTPVYAVAAGVVYLDRPNAVGIRVGRGHAYDYWHIVPVVQDNATVAEHQLIGYVAPGFGHVHFAEIEDGYVVNPTRPGALEPQDDHVPPAITDLHASADGKALDASHLQGHFDLIAEISDVADLAPPPPWQSAIVTPALVRWRLEAESVPLTRWTIAVDFRTIRLRAEQFRNIYAPGTRQNEPGRPGRYVFYLAHGFDSTSFSGTYELEVAASDTSGNTTVKKIRLRIVEPHGRLQRAASAERRPPG